MTAAKAILGLVIGSLFMQCLAFSIASRPVAIGYYSPPPYALVAKRSVLFMSEPRDDDVEATSSQSPEEEEQKISDGEKKPKGLSMVPLFLKFCVVLAVKFITDVMVFPALFIFRLVRLIYKQFAKVVGKLTKTGVNGESSESS